MSDSSVSFPVFLTVIGAVFFALGMVAAVRTRRFLARAVRVPGTVVELRFRSSSVSDSPGSGSYYPVLAFRTLDGRDVVTESDCGSSPAPARRGAVVTVLYDPDNPNQARVDNRRGRGGCLGPVLATVGAACTVGGVIGIVAGLT